MARKTRVIQPEPPAPRMQTDESYARALAKHAGVKPGHVPNVISVLVQYPNVGREQEVLEILKTTSPEWFS